MNQADSSVGTKRLLLSVLGLGPPKDPKPYYTPTKYARGSGEPSRETPLVQQALVELAEGTPFDRVVLIMTPEVRARWHDSGLLKELSFGSYVPLEVGTRQADFDAFFGAVVKELLSDGLEHVEVDVTHGFRTQPMIVLSALDFARSEWARQRRENPPKVRVSYGAYEARSGDVAPIWDMTDLVTAGRWNSAIDAVIRYGRGDDFELLGKEHARKRLAARPEATQREQASIAGPMSGIAGAVKKFCDDVATGRTMNLFSESAPRLRNAVRALGDASGVPPQVRKGLESLEAQASKLAVDGLSKRARYALLSAPATQALVEYARFCMQIERFAEAAAAVREASVSLHGLRNAVVEEHLEEQARTSSRPLEAVREELERDWRWYGAHALGRNPSGIPSHSANDLEAAKFGANCGDLRNDVEHLGFRSNARDAGTIRRDLQSFVKELDSLVPRTGFVNLSNHPLGEWSRAQLDAASALGHGDPCDLSGGLPTIDPNADEASIAKLARELAQQVWDQGHAAAHVAGEYTFTLVLVRELQLRGLECYAATGERDVASTVDTDGTVHSTRAFRFVRWRKYPKA